MIENFIDLFENNNSKTYYYVRMISRHPIALLTNNEREKKEIKKTYKPCAFFNVKNAQDLIKLTRKIVSGEIKKIIVDDMETLEDFYKNRIYSHVLFKYIITDDEIRDIILTDIALEKYSYE